MANTTNETLENVLVSLKIDLPTSAQAIEQLTKSTNELKKAVDDVNATTKDSTAAREQSAAVVKRQEEAVKKNQDALKAEAGSIADLRKQNSELTKERNNTSLATDAGRKRVEELNDKLDENNAKIKENVDAYTKQKIGVGGYTEALDKLVPGLGATVSGIQASTKAALAFIATPLGLVIGALGLAIGAVVAYFKSSEEAQNKWNRIVNTGSALLEQLMNKVEDLGGFLVGLFDDPMASMEKFWKFLQDQIINRLTGLGMLIPRLGQALVQLFSGDFAEAGKTAANAIGQIAFGVEDTVGLVTDLIDGVKEVWKEAEQAANEAMAMAKRLSDVQEAIDAAEHKLIVDRARTNLEVLKLRTKAIQEDGDVRRATIQDAIALEEQLADRELAQAIRRQEEAALKVQIAGNDKDALFALDEANAAVFAAQAERFNATIRFQKELEALRDAEIAAKKKAAEDQKKIDDKTAADQKANADAELKAMQDFYAKQKKLDDDAAKAKATLDQKNAEGQTDLLNNVLKTQKINYGEAFKLGKQGALKQLFIDQKKAAMAAYQSAAEIPFVGFILGPIAYAAAWAQGAAALASITGLSLGFARSGRVPLSGTKIGAGMGIPIQRANGDDLLVTAKKGEVILNERHQAALGGSSTFRKLGVPGFASSGAIGGMIETRQALSALDLETQAQLIANTLANQPAPVLVLQDFEYAQISKDQAAGPAIVIK